MKTLTAILLLTMVLTANAEKEAIIPDIGTRFGQVVRIEAEFVEKPNDYRAHNFYKEPFLISVLAVNGQVLNKPIAMEYSAGTKGVSFEKGKRYQLEAYETIYSEGDPGGWNELVSQVDYHIVHRMVIRQPKPTGGEPIVGDGKPVPQR